jgi:hypothetical protein
MNSMSALFLTVFLLSVLVERFDALRLFARPRQLRIAPLQAGKHHAAYGRFLDAVPRPKDKKMDDLYDRLGLKEMAKSDDLVTGAELRSQRTRDLKLAVKENPVVENPNPEPQRNWSDEEINQVIECLNLSYCGKTREELTDEQRVGVVNWSEFDKHAVAHIDDYESPKTKKRVTSWIQYHIKKSDIKFDYDKWVWAPRKNNKKR